MDKNKKTGITILMLVGGMFAFTYAAFPLYSIFCKATGYGGTPKLNAKQANELGNRIITVRFNSSVASDIAWDFKPLQNQVTVRTGENKLIFFSAKNNSATPVTGMATFNISPDEAGQYFNKVACFCFKKQTLQPGQQVQMPVSFYIDPRIEKDLDLKGIDTITLSYTFFKATD